MLNNNDNLKIKEKKNNKLHKMKSHRWIIYQIMDQHNPLNIHLSLPSQFFFLNAVNISAMCALLSGNLNKQTKIVADWKAFDMFFSLQKIKRRLFNVQRVKMVSEPLENPLFSPLEWRFYRQFCNENSSFYSAKRDRSL